MAEPTVTFKKVFGDEIAVINQRRRLLAQKGCSDRGPCAAPEEGETDERGLSTVKGGKGNDLTGLTLSGGGIRSAAFCLGAMQAIDSVGERPERSLFANLDYLSAVSGGSYVATSTVCGMMQTGGAFPFASRLDEPERVEVKHLRDFSNFLVPNGSLDYVANAIAVLRGLITNAIIILPVLLFLAVATVLFHHGMASGAAYPFSIVEASALLPFRPLMTFAALLIAVQVGYMLYISLTFDRSTLSGRKHASTVFALLFVCLIALGVVEVQPVVLRMMLDGAVDSAMPQDGVRPGLIASLEGLTAVLLPVAVGLITFAQRLVNVAKATVGDKSWHGVATHIASRAIFFGSAAVVPVLLWIVYLTFCYWAIESAYAVDPHWHTPEWIRWLTGTTSVMTIANWLRLSTEPVTALYIILATGLSALCLIIGPNANSIHRCYRDRLSRAFLFEREKLVASGDVADAVAEPPRAAASALARRFASWTTCILLRLCGRGALLKECRQLFSRCDVDRWKFSSLKKRAWRSASSWSDDVAAAPYLLVNTALNLHNSHYLSRRHRRADFFSFSPLYVGSEATGFVPTRQIEREVEDLSLATAMAISGAAASSNMGANSSGLFAFSLALLNVRLGYWMKNPSRLASLDGLRRMIAGIGPLYFAFEAFSRLKERTLNVYLTDGGHIDNLGLYELLKRRCKVVVVIDAEADQGLTFDSFVRVQRYARIDLGVRIDMNWADVQRTSVEVMSTGGRKNTAPPPRREGPHAAIGTIEYGTEQKGVLIYIKSSVTGDETDYIRDYQRRHRTFPHETTVDQFFSEEQFEVYRALGFHAARGLFTGRDSVALPEEPDSCFAARVEEALALLGLPPTRIAAVLSRIRSGGDRAAQADFPRAA